MPVKKETSTTKAAAKTPASFTSFMELLYFS